MSLFDVLFRFSRKSHVMNNLLRFTFGCDIPENVKIGKGSVIGAGSLVMDNAPPHSIFYNTRESISEKMKNR